MKWMKTGLEENIYYIHKVEPLLKDLLPELGAEMLGLERNADGDEPLEGDEDGQVDGAALADHAQLTGVHIYKRYLKL